MLVLNPGFFEYGSMNDVIDYVSLGGVPTKKNFKRLMRAVGDPESTDVDDEENPVVIPWNIMDDDDRITLEKVMKRVYKNRKKNRNMALAFHAALGLVVIGAMVGSKHHDHDPDCHCIAATPDIMDDYAFIDAISLL